MGATIPNREAVHAAALASIAALEERFARNVKALIHEADTLIKAKTPVNTGQAVRNMIWHNGPGDGRVYEAEGTIDPGPTNTMALGTEPRRAQNEAAAAQSLNALDFTNPFKVYTLENNSPDIVGLELGIFPRAPLNPRSPGGMFEPVSTFIAAKVAAKGILS